ncbi:hypothetical protein GALMADRAFT_144493 [Galerina marginata CBS 339.88]|uniref:Uncharacterized protein n=1 Tax=Galerina marginata (strain CBS 339.88) TaxID=685588 RepID=A0A067SSD4_GALM3|nr:hypothetical protein GALMADRAFT_144493 [Galerina marginata CBS 339.88]
MDRVSLHYKNFSDVYLGGNVSYASIRNPSTNLINTTRHKYKDSNRDCWIFGEIMSKQYGTKFGAAVQTHERRADGDSVQDVIAIKCPASVTPEIVMAWKRQLTMLAKFQEEDIMNNHVNELYPMSIKDWGVRLDGLPDRLFVIWEKYTTVDRSLCKVLKSKDRAGVKLGAFYEPTVLSGFSKPYFDLHNDVLRQNWILNDTGLLIPPWLQATLALGSIMYIVALLSTFI